MVAGLTRRALLARGAVAGAGLVVAGCGGASSGASRPARTAAQLDIALLTKAREAELRSESAYRTLASELGGARSRLALRIAGAERRHAAALEDATRALGAPGLPAYAAVLALDGGLAEALRLEAQTAADYLELLPRLRVPAVREVVGFILAEEAAHAAALRAALGREPVTGAFL